MVGTPASPAGRSARTRPSASSATCATRRGTDTRIASAARAGSPGTADNGGVHRNSGVGNKTAYLIAAGGQFNDQDVDGIGVEKTARLYYLVMSEWLTSASDYLDLGDALEGACADLVDSYGFTTSDCTAVGHAVAATQLHLRPAELAPSQAPVCGSGKTAQDVFSDDLEAIDSGHWKPGLLVGKARGWYYPPNPNNDRTWMGPGRQAATRTSTASIGARAATRSCDWPSRSSPFRPARSCASSMATRSIRAGSGSTAASSSCASMASPGRTSARSASPTAGTTDRIATGTGNPLKGRRAFTGESHGYGASRVDLSDFAGQTVELRFRLGSDRSGGGQGWYIDDIRVYTCEPA